MKKKKKYINTYYNIIQPQRRTEELENYNSFFFFWLRVYCVTDNKNKKRDCSYAF